MLDQGYGDGDLSLRLHQLKFYHARRLNAILDHKMHCSNMTDEEAMKLLVDRGFQTEAEAVGKIARAKQSSTQLSTYFVGRTAFYRLRQDVQRKQGDKFDLGKYPRGRAEPRHAAGEVPARVGEVNRLATMYNRREEIAMPLRDHFHSSKKRRPKWETVHGMWPAIIALRLNSILPPEYRCEITVHLGTLVELDVATYQRDEEAGAPPSESSEGVGTAWAAESPTLLLETEELTPAEYEVRVYDDGETLVAAIELVSPSNKDRPQSRNAFVDKCHAMLQQGVCVVIVDTVTSLSSNLYAELAERLGAKEPAIADCSIYAVTCRTRPGRRGVRVETWEHRLSVGSPLPTLPLYLTETLKVPLELEAAYEETCRGLRIP